MNRHIVTGLLFVLMAMTVVGGVYAAVLPRHQGAKPVADNARPAKQTSNAGVCGSALSASFTPARDALMFTVAAGVRDLKYSFTYDTQGKPDGSIGSIPEGGVTREITLGTCSSGVCRMHAGISNIKMDVTFRKDGKEYHCWAPR